MELSVLLAQANHRSAFKAKPNRWSKAMIHDVRFSNYDKFIILQVQVLPANFSFYSEENLMWRDAKVEDLLAVSEHLQIRYEKHPRDDEGDINE
jgi:hypothetical protein